MTMKRFLPIVVLLAPFFLFAQEVKLERVEPPNWWTGFKNPEVQLMVYGKNIATTTVSVDYPGFVIKKIHKTDNPNYLFLDMTISPGTRPGLAVIQFKSKDKVAGKYLYELNERKKGSAPPGILRACRPPSLYSVPRGKCAGRSSRPCSRPRIAAG